MSRLGSPTDNLSRDWSGSAPDIGSQLTAENRSIEVGGDSLVYRRFGNTETNAPPLLCLQHFRSNLDFWDPALVDRIAQDREVILFDNRGVSASTGTRSSSPASASASFIVSTPSIPITGRPF